jgi:hypothetical protein
MTSNFIRDFVRRSSLTQLILFGIGFAFVIAAIALSTNAYHNLLAGPFTVAKDYVLSLSNLSDAKQYHITIEADDALDTGYSYVTTEDGRETGRKNYTALVLDDRLLLVETKGDVNSRSHTGALVNIPHDVQREVIDQLVKEVPQIEGAFLPFMLETENFKTNTILGLVATSICLLIAVWGVLRSALRLSDANRHPIMRALGRFGEAEQVADQIDHEVNSHHEQVGNIKLTRNWLVHQQGLTFNAMRFSDMVWMYKHVLKTKYYGVVTVNKTYSAYLWDRHGHRITITAREKQVDEMLQAIYRRAPGIIVGYDPQLEKQWKKNRGALVQAVDQQRAQAAAG